MIFIGVLIVCFFFSILLKGKEVYGYVFRVGISRESFIGGIFVNMYCKCGFIDSVKRVFDMFCYKDLVLCLFLVLGYV